jgi:hypothetical protein
LEDYLGREGRAGRRLRDNDACFGLHRNAELDLDRPNPQARVVSLM